MQDRGYRGHQAKEVAIRVSACELHLFRREWRVRSGDQVDEILWLLEIYREAFPPVMSVSGYRDQLAGTRRLQSGCRCVDEDEITGIDERIGVDLALGSDDVHVWGQGGKRALSCSRRRFECAQPLLRGVGTNDEFALRAVSGGAHGCGDPVIGMPKREVPVEARRVPGDVREQRDQ